MASKLRMTLKQVYLIPAIRNMILSEDSPSIFAVVIYVEAKITSVAVIYQNRSPIVLIGRCSSMRCGHTSLTQKNKRRKTQKLY